MKALLILAGLLVAVPLHAQDRPFTIARSALIAASGADLAVTEYRLSQGFREGGLGRGLEQHPVIFGLVKGSVLAGTAYVLQRLHRRSPKLALGIALIATGVEVAVTMRNARLQVPR